MTLTEFNEQEFIENRKIEGRAEGRAEAIEKLLQKHYTAEEVADMLDADIALVKSIEERLCSLV